MLEMATLEEALRAVPGNAARWHAKITILSGRPSWRFGLLLPIPRWAGGSGQSHPHGVDRTVTTVQAEAGERKGGWVLPAKIQAAVWRAALVISGRQTLVFRADAARTHGHEGRAARSTPAQGPWADLPTQGAGAR